MIKNPGSIIRMFVTSGLLTWLPDKQYLQLLYRLRMKKRLNLESPQTYNEKLQWLKLHDRKPEYTQMVDKYEVRAFVKEQLGEEYLIPLVGGPWRSFDQIDFDMLPEQFVLKVTHDSGGVIVCKDKKKFDYFAARKKLGKALKHNYYHRTREWPYKNVVPQIIAEQYMEDSTSQELRDYKFFCFDGTPKALFIATERQTAGVETKFDFFDMKYNHLEIRNGHPNAEILPDKPQQFEQMQELARKLSKGIPHVRVDFYEVDGRIYFGEITFYHWSGMIPFEPKEWDKTFGEWITLPKE